MAGALRGPLLLLQLVLVCTAQVRLTLILCPCVLFFTAWSDGGAGKSSTDATRHFGSNGIEWISDTCKTSSGSSVSSVWSCDAINLIILCTCSDVFIVLWLEIADNSWWLNLELSDIFYFTQRSQGPPGPPGVPGINGIDVSCFFLINFKYICYSIFLLKYFFLLLQGERGADGEDGFPVSIGKNNENDVLWLIHFLWAPYC